MEIIRINLTRPTEYQLFFLMKLWKHLPNILPLRETTWDLVSGRGSFKYCGFQGGASDDRACCDTSFCMLNRTVIW